MTKLLNLTHTTHKSTMNRHLRTLLEFGCVIAIRAITQAQAAD